MAGEDFLAVRRGKDDGLARLIISHALESGDYDGPTSKLTVVCTPEAASSVLQTFVFDIVELGDDLSSAERTRVSALCTLLRGDAPGRRQPSLAPRARSMHRLT